MIPSVAPSLQRFRPISVHESPIDRGLGSTLEVVCDRSDNGACAALSVMSLLLQPRLGQGGSDMLLSQL